MKYATRFLLTIVFSLFAVPLFLVVPLVLLKMHVAVTVILLTMTVILVGTYAASRALAERLVRWAWKE